jgi:hypothetical protein
MGFLCALQVMVVSIPLIPLIWPPHPPTSEFSGIAVVGEVFIVCGSALAIGFLGGMGATLAMYRETNAPRFLRISKALATSLAIFAVGLIFAYGTRTGVYWDAGVSIVVIAIGLPVALRKPYVEKRWGED